MKVRKADKIAKKIVRINRKSRPSLQFLTIFCMTAIAFSLFIFFGAFFLNIDVTTSKVFDRTYFINDDMTRIVIRRMDGLEITDEDVEKVRKVRCVEAVEEYDCVSDIVVATEVNEDYKVYYNKRNFETELPSHTTYRLKKREKFMKTVTCISEDDLKEGSMAKGLYDIVIYSEDESVLGTTMNFYLAQDNLWGVDMINVNCTVVGLLKEETEQIYFSEKMGQMMVAKPGLYIDYMMEDESNTQLRKFMENSGAELKKTNKLGLRIWGSNGADSEEPVIETKTFSTEEEYNEYLRYASANKVAKPIFIINEDLKGNEVIVSNEFVDTTYRREGIGYQPTNICSVLKYTLADDWFYGEYLESEDWISDGELTWEEYEARKARAVGFEIIFEAKEECSNSTERVIEVSREMYEKVAGNVPNTQMAAYIEDYAYTDEVIDKLSDMGYDVASAYRMAATEYDEDIVKRKNVSMLVALGAFSMVFPVGLFIMVQLMRLRSKDLKKLHMLGLENEKIKQINVLDIRFNIIVAVAVSMLIITILTMLKISYVVNIVKYYKAVHYILYAITICAFAVLLMYRTNKKYILSRKNT